MTQEDFFSGKAMDTETDSSEDLRQSLGACSPEWCEAVLAELARRGEPFTPSLGGVPWPMEAPVSPYPTRDSAWDSLPGTLARHDEEEKAIHGIN